MGYAKYSGLGGSGGGGSGSTYTNSNPVPNTVGGITAGTTLTGPFTLQQMFDMLLYPYIAPSFSSFSASPSTITIREFGNNVTSEVLTAVTVKHTNPITSVTFYLDGTLIHTQASPISGGGSEIYTDSTTISTNGHLYQAKVSDGTTTTNSALIGYDFVYPYYYGIGSAGITSSGSAIRATGAKVIGDTVSVAFTSSPVSQVFFFCYPAAYPALTSILDTNGFETISSYTVGSIGITGLDGTTQTYRTYELSIATTQTAFTNTFKQ